MSLSPGRNGVAGAAGVSDFAASPALGRATGVPGGDPSASPPRSFACIAGKPAIAMSSAFTRSGLRVLVGADWRPTDRPELPRSGVSVRSNAEPSRCLPWSRTSPVESTTDWKMSPKLRISSSFMDSMRSPSFIPAIHAGNPGTTFPTTGEGSFTPYQ